MSLNEFDPTRVTKFRIKADMFLINSLAIWQAVLSSGSVNEYYDFCRAGGSGWFYA